MPAYDKQRYYTDEEYRNSIKLAQRKHFQRLRYSAMKALGMKCSECDIEDYRVLQFDHINNDGNIERAHSQGWRNKKEPQKGSTSWTKNKMYKAVRDGTRDDIQLLCANHHALKTFEENYAETDFIAEFIEEDNANKD